MQYGSSTQQASLSTTEIVLLVIAAALNAGGWFLNLFQAVWWYDDVSHFVTIFAVTLALGGLIFGPVRAGFAGQAWRYVLAVASLGLAIGALWEMAEWVVLSHLKDTVVDLMLDGLGGLAAAWIASRGLE